MNSIPNAVVGSDPKQILKLLVETYVQLKANKAIAPTLLTDFKFWMTGVSAIINANTMAELRILCITYICSITPQRYPITVEAMKLFMSCLQSRIYSVQTNRMVTETSQAIALLLFRQLITDIARSRGLTMEKMLTNLATESHKRFPPE